MTDEWKAQRHHKLQRNKRFRDNYFRACPSPFLVTRFSPPNPVFIVETADLGISRRLYVKGSYGTQAIRTALGIDGVRGRSLVEIGAHVGPLSIELISDGTFENALAIEPTPESFRLLVANTYLNSLEGKIRPVNCAVGVQQSSKGQLRRVENSSGENWIDYSGREGPRSENMVLEVPSRSLDSLIKEHADFIQPDELFLVIDTQGSELEVLQGAQHTLSQHPPLVVEYAPSILASRGRLDQMRRMLFDLGYPTIRNLSQLSDNQCFASEDDLRSMEMSMRDGEFTDLLLMKK